MAKQVLFSILQFIAGILPVPGNYEQLNRGSGMTDINENGLPKNFGRPLGFIR